MAKDNYKALTENFSQEQLDALNNKIKTNSANLEEMVNQVVNEFFKPLDTMMSAIKDGLNDTVPPSDGELDYWSCMLSSYLYFAGEGVESIGIRADISKAFKQDKYNSIYDSQVNGTIADKTAQAELGSQQEYLINSIYTRAYKKAQQKVEAGNEMLQSIKKVISRRMGSYALSIRDKGEFKER